MSIIGCVVFVLTIICILAWGADGDPNNEAALGWGLIGAVYGIALSIVGIVQSNNTKKRR